MKNLFVLSFLCLTLLSGCKEAEIDTLATQLEGSKNEVLKQMSNAPYQATQHELLKSYFSKAAELNWELVDDSSKVKRLNQSLVKKDIGQLCERILIKKKDWDVIIANCTVNRYFLCADAVAEYQNNLAALKKLLTPENAVKLQQSKSCNEVTGG